MPLLRVDDAGIHAPIARRATFCMLECTEDCSTTATLTPLFVPRMDNSSTHCTIDALACRTQNQ
jgi:hypothetical protein